MLSVLLILLALVPFAHASPPDPLWIPGLYDGADADDAIQAITDGSGVRMPANEAPALVAPQPSTTPVGLAIFGPPPQQVRSTRSGRSPPHI